MDLTQYYLYGKYILILLGMGVFMWGYFKYNEVRRTVGWNFVSSLGMVKLNLGGKDLVLRIKLPTGRETYKTVKQSPLIEYDVKDKENKPLKKIVIYDERAVDYLNGIPILNVTPYDIRPLDRNTGLLVNISPEIILKLAVDSSKTVDGEKSKDKTIKMLTWAVIGMGILFIVGIAYLNQTNTEVQAELLKCTLRLGQTATVIAG